MTGPEHYAEAERLITQAHKALGLLGDALPRLNAAGVETSRELISGMFAAARTHATLALAAATALSGVTDPDRWLAVAS